MEMSKSAQLKAIFSFDVLVDLDYGTLRYVESLDLYLDKELFHQRFFSLPPKIIKETLCERIYPNPISILAIDYYKEDVKNKIDKLYNKIISENYLEIQKRAVRTTCLEMFKKFIDSQGEIFPTILCDNTYQAKYITILLNDCLDSAYSIRIRDGSDLSGYDVYYIKYSNKLEDTFGLLVGKNLYISEIRLNMIEKDYLIGKLIPKTEDIVSYMSSNVIHTFTLYPKDENYYYHYNKDEKENLNEK